MHAVIAKQVATPDCLSPQRARPGVLDAEAAVSCVANPPDAGPWIELAAGSMRSIVVQTMTTVTCKRGTMWLTADYCTDDIVLERGDTYPALESGRLVIVALTPAAYRISNQPSPRPRFARRAGMVQSLQQFLRSSRLRLQLPGAR